MPSPFDQSSYQVRFEHGATGLDRLAPSEIVVVVDVLRFSSTVGERVAAGERVALDAAAHAVSVNGAAVAERAAASGSLVLLGSLRGGAAVARAVLAEQERRAGRTSVAVIAAGELDAQGVLRPAVEDVLGAGAVIEALAERGIDHSSPEAAATAATFAGLAPAIRHLLSASGSGRELAARGLSDDVRRAALRDADAVAPVLRDGMFLAYR